MSNGAFNFNFLALVCSKILGGPKFTLGGPVPPSTPPSGIFFVPQASTLLCLINVKKLQKKQIYIYIYITFTFKLTNDLAICYFLSLFIVEIKQPAQLPINLLYKC